MCTQVSLRLVAVCGLVASGLLSQAQPALAQPVAGQTARSVDQLLPSSTILYFEVPRPAQLLETIWESTYRQQVMNLEQVKTALQQPQAQEFQNVVAATEQRLGMTWREAVEKLTAQGVYAAVDANTQGLAVMLHGQNADEVEKIMLALVDLARQEATRQGNPDILKESEYQGIRAFEVDKGGFALAGEWVLITNQSKLAKSILDQYLGGRERSLADVTEFQEARRTAPEAATAWGYINLLVLRAVNQPKELFDGRTDNPAAELLVGGIKSLLRKAPYATVALQVESDVARLSLALPQEAGWIEEARTYYFGPESRGKAPNLAKVPDTLFSLSTYRDIGQMWMYAGDLFDENMNDKLAEADSQLSTLFSGKDFGSEILGALAPQVQFVAARQNFDQLLPRPTIKLPSFAAIFRLNDADANRDEFRRTFQSLVGFLNVVGAMEGNPQLDMSVERKGDDVLITSRYVPEADERESTAARIQFNFSPSVAISGDRMVVSSTESLARALWKIEETGDSPEATNSQAFLDAQVLQQVLEDNRRQLVTQNMLENGHSKEEAEYEVGTLLQIMEAFRHLALKMDTADAHLRLSLELQLKP